jgi:hypothetical protein
MKFKDATRYEFREFGRDLTAARDAFAALGSGIEQEPSRETYIVTRLNIESNVKIRKKKLEVKGLTGRLLLLEQWQPILNTKLPVSADELENVVAPAIGIDVELDGATEFDKDALLALADDQPALAAAVVEKQRTLFDLGDCEAEFCELEIDGDKLQTIAIEAVDAAAANAVLRRTGLIQGRNESYPAFLQRRLFPPTG